ncbi:hypothetical protein KCP77_16120 [Salmonella enterica subsp. enterica]|nr:hypothetical protein KCP77_16120 [Salmonella enterica subsp. enterica]
MLDKLLSALFSRQLDVNVASAGGARQSRRRWRREYAIVTLDMNRMFTAGVGSPFAESDETRRARELELSLETFFSSGRGTWYAGIWIYIPRHSRGSHITFAFFGVLPQRDSPWEADFLAWLGAAGLEGVGISSGAKTVRFTHF